MDFEFNGDELEFRTPAGLRIAGRHWGFSDGFPLLALHGWLDNCATWEELIPLWLGKHGVRFNMVAIDFAGHGRSEHRHPQAPYSKILDIEDSISVADALGWERFALIGHSMGGVNSMYIACMYPSRVEHAVIIEAIAPLFTEDEPGIARMVASRREHKAYFSRKNPEASKRVFKSLEDAAVSRANGTHQLSLRASRLLVARGTRPVAPGSTDLVWSSDQRLILPDPFPTAKSFVLELLSHAQAPILTIMADHDFPPTYGSPKIRKILGPKHEAKLMQGMPSHHLHMEAETIDAVAAVIAEFWKKQPSTSARNGGPSEEDIRAKL
ncbi:Serine hydrolase-like protein 2 [Polyrhizophydium stewartii]|uniref:Serine hydrolase-like protein 2 n=1 Tax=Polyrhizophydium stewartii TaxID=2732419 RepID=A0ABR4N8H6_9FUNG|nr:hypothetical protein HK105_008253 [Polyrhizophydium stewartii]